MFLAFIHLISCFNQEDYLIGKKADCYGEIYPFFRFSHILPGQKLYPSSSKGGVSNIVRFTAKSQSEAENFFRKMLSETKDYQSVIAKLKYPKFRVQLNTMSTHEVYDSDSVFDGRCFEIKSHFISFNKEGNNYNIVYAPFTVSLISRTFFTYEANLNHWLGEVVYESYRVYDSFYEDEGFMTLKNGYRLINAPFRYLISAENIEKIYARLSKLVAAEREKFVKLPY